MKLARLLLLVVALLGGIRLLTFDYPGRVSTSVIDLVPVDERSPELTLLRTLASERQARVLLFGLSRDGQLGEPPVQAARQFADLLRQSPLFAEVTVLPDTATNDSLAQFLADRRLDLLLPGWLARQERAFATSGRPQDQYSGWLAETTADALDSFLLRPEASSLQQLIVSDPLLLVPGLARRAGIMSPATGSIANGGVRVWALLAVSPLSPEGQEPVFRVIDGALSDLQASDPAITLEWTGVNRFAAASESRIRGELTLFNVLALAAVAGITLIFVQRAWRALHLLPVILFSMLGGWLGVTLAFERVHILVFVVGALLIGVASDYGFHIYLQPAHAADEPYRLRLRRLLKPLLTCCLTTVIGFSLLLLSELPLIRQIGVFVSAGLFAALGSAMLYFAQVRDPWLPTRPIARRRVGRLSGYGRIIVGIAALAVVGIGFSRLEWRDDIRELEVPNPALEAGDQRVRAMFGEGPGQTVYASRGDSLAEARAALDRFTTWHESAFPDASVVSTAQILPAPAELEALPDRLAKLRDFGPRLREALEAHGYAADAFAPFFSDWDALLGRETPPAFAELATEFESRLRGPLGLGIFTAGASTWLISVADHPPGSEPPVETSTLETSQLQSLNSLFARYRESAFRLSLLGLGLLGISVIVLYGPARGMRIFLVPAGSCLLAFGLLGLLHGNLNLFHLLGALLGVCLSHDYAIFTAEKSGPDGAPPISIRLSALTTAASFGVLSLSSIPVVAALGATVALIVIVALALVELEAFGANPIAKQ